MNSGDMLFAKTALESNLKTGFITMTLQAVLKKVTCEACSERQHNPQTDSGSLGPLGWSQAASIVFVVLCHSVC